MANNKGEWLGKGFSVIKESKLSWKRNWKPNYPPPYFFEIKQGPYDEQTDKVRF